MHNVDVGYAFIRLLIYLKIIYFVIEMTYQINIQNNNNIKKIILNHDRIQNNKDFS